MRTLSNLVQTDTVLKAKQETPELNIELQKISLSDIRSIRVDSSKLKKPKVQIPQPKTEAIIPLTDSVDHPVFNSLSGKYSFPADNYNSPVWYNEYEPLKESESIRVTKHKVAEQEHLPENIKITQAITDVSVTQNTDKEKGFASTEWMLGIIILCLIIFGWIKVGFGKFINTLVLASYNYHTAKRIQDEPNALRKRVFYFMNALFFLVLPLFITQWLIYNNILIWEKSGFILYLITFTICIIIYATKSFSLLLLDFLFLGKGSFVSYNSTVFIYNKILSFCLLPLVSVIPFVPLKVVPWGFNIGFLLLIFFYIMRISRGIVFSIRNRVSLFYLFLYLCALEILPVTVLFKIISELM